MSAMSGWGYMMNRLHDQLSVAHLLRGDNSPACGARYYTSAGPCEVHPSSRCRNCLRIEARQERPVR